MYLILIQCGRGRAGNIVSNTNMTNVRYSLAVLNYLLYIKNSQEKSVWFFSK